MDRVVLWGMLWYVMSVLVNDILRAFSSQRLQLACIMKMFCIVLEHFKSKSPIRNNPRIGSSLTLTCTPPTSFPHAEIYWAVITADNRFSPIDYTDRVTQDPIGRVCILSVSEYSVVSNWHDVLLQITCYLLHVVKQTELLCVCNMQRIIKYKYNISNQF